MRVGILTYHYARNFGAAIQAYALRKTVQKIVGSGHIVEIINYRPVTFKNTDESLTDINYWQQKIIWDRFLEKECGIASICVSNIADIPEYDYYIVGSDQVWNPKLPVKEETGEYFLDFVPEEKVKIAYAVSIGEKITSNFNTILFERNIPRFDFISLREHSYVPFISRFTEKECQAVLDPSFLLEIQEYEELMREKNVEQPYILCVIYGMKVKRRIFDFVNRYSIKNNYGIVHMEKEITPYWFMNEEFSMRYSGIEEMLWTIKNAKLIITDSFHFTAFSIIFRKPFYAMPGNRSSRITDLLDSLGLKERIFKDTMQLNEMNEYVDYRNVEKVLEEKKVQSIEFLKRALRDIVKEQS